MDIRLEQVTTHNLKSVSVAFPRNALTVVTGVSGSGKSSLVFDSLYAESYRRFMDSLSSFARQYMQSMPKPEIQHVENLPASVSVRQSRSGLTQRSTVGTLTELWDCFREMYAALAQPHCSVCSRPLERWSLGSMAKAVARDYQGKDVLVMAPLSLSSSSSFEQVVAEISALGFPRVWQAGAVRRLKDLKPDDLTKPLSLVIDRLTKLGEGKQARLADALRTAEKAGKGLVQTALPGALPGASTGALAVLPRTWSTYHRCPDHPDIKPAKTSPAFFSFNHPLGACEHCQGFGKESVLDWDRVIPDLSSSLAEGGVAAWNFGRSVAVYDVARSALPAGRSELWHKAFSDYSQQDWEWLKNGTGKRFKGVHGYFSWLATKKYKAHYRIHSARFHRYVECSVCKGTRLKPQTEAFRLQKMSLSELGAMPIDRLQPWLKRVAASLEDEGSADKKSQLELLDETSERLSYLERVGLGYLTLNRAAPTLSGGELQRIHLARCLGTRLTDTLYCLDEPSAGLHPKDAARLLAVLQELVSLRNTVVCVEHERSFIEAAEHVIEIGPKAGHLGGQLVFAGRFVDMPAAFKPRAKAIGQLGASHPKRVLRLKGGQLHNLKAVDVGFAVGQLNVVCGVSGSGKSSLVQHTLYPLLARHTGDKDYARHKGGATLGPAHVLAELDAVYLMSQSQLQRSSRSNVGTYLGLFQVIRNQFAAQPKAKSLGLKPGSFSFNVPGGRCETCKGLGVVVENLSFLGDMEVTCPSCQGRRFSEEVLSVRYKGKNLSQMLQMTIEQVRDHCGEVAAIRRICDTVISMGLGYVTLGQPTSRFSGGEAQRLKLASLIVKAELKKKKRYVFIFDEPTTGLADRDVEVLLSAFGGLKEQGHTLIVIEHHLNVISAADWVIELGPGAGPAGGEIVYAGHPSQMMEQPRSATAGFLTHKQGVSG